MRYDRTVIAYHGCDHAIAERLLRGSKFKASRNIYDWLGKGVYFWEFGEQRAIEFAIEQKRRGNVKRPAVIGAIIQLGRCFDLLDTRFTADLARSYRSWFQRLRQSGELLPANVGLKHDLDCAVLNWYLDRERLPFDSVRCAFREGKPVFPGSEIYLQSHIQLAVRNPDCIIGVFRPKMRTR